MDTKKLDASLSEIIEKKIQLHGMSYDDKDYDKVEEELHDLEDQFMDSYGDFMEDALEKVHEELCPENDVLMPIAYLAHNYKKSGKNPDGSVAYEVEGKEGVWVDVEKFDGRDTRLVLIPNPARLVLMVDGKQKEIVWKAV